MSNDTFKYSEDVVKALREAAELLSRAVPWIKTKEGLDHWHEITRQIDDLADRVEAKKPRMVTLTGPGGTYSYPEPMKEAPKRGATYSVVTPYLKDLFVTFVWYDRSFDHRQLDKGICHATGEAAKQHARAWILASGGELPE